MIDIKKRRLEANSEKTKVLITGEEVKPVELEGSHCGVCDNGMKTNSYCLYGIQELELRDMQKLQIIYWR